MNLEQFDFVIRYDPKNGLALADEAAMNYADEIVKCGKLDITVGSEFLLTAIRYSMKKNNIDPSRAVFVVPIVINGQHTQTTVRIEPTYNLDYGLEGRFDYPNHMTGMLMELF